MTESRAVNYEEKYYDVMDALKRSRRKHGRCIPPERKACTACMAIEELNAMLSEYKGRPVRLM